jgi:hypothetical protein
VQISDKYIAFLTRSICHFLHPDPISPEHLSPKGMADENQKYASIPGFREQHGREDTAAYEHNLNLLALAEMRKVEGEMNGQADYVQRRREYAAQRGEPLPEPGALENVRLGDLKWNPEDDSVTHVPTGRRLSEGDFEQIVSGLVPGRSGIGQTTLSRALIARQALLGDASGGDSVPNLGDEELGGRGREEADANGSKLFKLLEKGKKLFYSQPDSSDTGGSNQDNSKGGSGRKLASHFGTDPRQLAGQTAQTVDTLNQRVPGLLHDKTHGTRVSVQILDR